MLVFCCILWYNRDVVIFILKGDLKMIPEEEKVRIINNIKTSMEMENQNLKATDIALLNDFADNKISMEDAVNSIKTKFFNI